MNKENKQKQQLVAQTVQQLIQFGKDPENKHFAYVGVDGDLYEAEAPNSGNVILSGNIGLLTHLLYDPIRIACTYARAYSSRRYRPCR